MKQPATSHSLRVASYNIRKAVGLDRRRDPARIASVLARLDADIVAVQEVDRRLGRRPAALSRDMIAAKTDFAPVEVAQNHVSLGWHGNAILVGPKVRATKVAHIPLTSPDPRGAVLVDIDAPVPITLVAVHLSLFRSARRRQLTEIRQALDARAPRPAIILGDFNEWRTRTGTEPLTDGFSLVAPGKSFHAARPVAALDRVAYSDHFTLTDAGVRQCDLARVASDHLPVWADLSITAPADLPPREPVSRRECEKMLKII